jgi:ribonuclease HI
VTKNPLVIYTDGACSGNPGPGGWGAIVADGESVVELGGGEAHTTNNRMELKAVIEALKMGEGPVILCVDSTYVMEGAQKWMAGWKRKGWKTSIGEPVLNRDLWEELDALLQKRTVAWRWVRGHVGNAGNHRCDRIAVSFSKGKPIELYGGPRRGYPVGLSVPDHAPAPERKQGSGKSKKKEGGYYLSLLDGKLEKHLTWPECQARVHGKNAKFKKVSGAEEERDVLKSWGAA